MPADLSYATAADFEFDLPADITCTVCKIAIGTAGDVGDAMALAREHEHR